MNQSRIAILSLVAALVAATSFTSNAHGQAASTHLAAVNLQKVYATMQETAEFQKHIQGMQGELKTMQDSHQAQLKEAQDKIQNTVKSNTDAYKAALDELDTKSLNFALDEQTMKLKMTREANRQLKNTFDEIKSTVADLAKKNGYDLVMVASDPELPTNIADSTDFEHLAQALFSRNVLYISEKVDITSQVVTQLDAAFKAHK